jgi:hypothetical protein
VRATTLPAPPMLWTMSPAGVDATWVSFGVDARRYSRVEQLSAHRAGRLRITCQLPRLVVPYLPDIRRTEA